MTDQTQTLAKIRYDNVGSLVRPETLLQAYGDHAAGRITHEALVAQQEAAIRDVIAEQERHGYPVVVDGEFRRRVFTESFSEVEGLRDWEERYAQQSVRIAVRDPAESDRWGASSHELRVPATARLRLLRNRPAEHFAFAQALTGTPVKATIVGPERVLQTLDTEGSSDFYADPWQFLDDIVTVQRDIVAGLRDAGCRYVHVDAPGFTAYVDPPSLARMRSRGYEPRELMTRAIAAENAVIAGFPDVTFGIHLCRGNQRGHWHREGPYDDVAEELFNDLDHQRLLLEYDTERSGTFAPLRFVPTGKIAVLGLVTTKAARVESADELRRRIDEASQHLDLDQVAISPQCGFESSAGGAMLTADEQWRKLDVCLEVGREVWG